MQVGEKLSLETERKAKNYQHLKSADHGDDDIVFRSSKTCGGVGDWVEYGRSWVGCDDVSQAEHIGISRIGKSFTFVSRFSSLRMQQTRTACAVSTFCSLWVGDSVFFLLILVSRNREQNHQQTRLPHEQMHLIIVHPFRWHGKRKRNSRKSNDRWLFLKSSCKTTLTYSSAPVFGAMEKYSSEWKITFLQALDFCLHSAVRSCVRFERNTNMHWRPSWCGQIPSLAWPGDRDLSLRSSSNPVLVFILQSVQNTKQSWYSIILTLFVIDRVVVSLCLWAVDC